MKDAEKEIRLMSTKEYMAFREKAIKKLESAQVIDEEECMVGKHRILTEEKDTLLEQLTGEYEYLTVPLELYLTDIFWRTLKVEANNRIRRLKIQITDGECIP